MLGTPTRSVVLALGVGLALAALCKSAYDAWGDGDASVPNALLSAGMTLSDAALQASLVASLVAISFVVTGLTLPRLSGSPKMLAASVALPWVVLWMISVAASIGGDGAASAGPLRIAALLEPLLPVVLAVPVGSWLATLTLRPRIR